MAETDIEIILERAKELYPEARPRIISDNGTQFIARDFKRTERSNDGNKSLKGECIRDRNAAVAR